MHLLHGLLKFTERAFFSQAVEWLGRLFVFIFAVGVENPTGRVEQNGGIMTATGDKYGLYVTCYYKLVFFKSGQCVELGSFLQAMNYMKAF